jgi:hypothetical protein
VLLDLKMNWLMGEQQMLVGREFLYVLILIQAILYRAVQHCEVLWSAMRDLYRQDTELYSTVLIGTQLGLLWPYGGLYRTSPPVQLPQSLLMLFGSPRCAHRPHSRY